ncbi:MAG: heme exporter protein CcmB [Bacteroidota bacterium]
MVQSIKNMAVLVRAEFQLDLKKPAVLASAILQMATMTLLAFLSQPQITAKIWNSLYWIILIFCTLQAVSKNFLGVNRARWIYFNQLAAPQAILWSKMIYGWGTMVLLTLANLLLFGFFMGFPIQHPAPYFLNLSLVVAGVSSIFTLIGAIASKANQAGFLAPVLSLPVVLPLILVGMQASNKTLNPVLVSSVYNDIALVGALDFLIVVLSIALFQPVEGLIYRNNPKSAVNRDLLTCPTNQTKCARPRPIPHLRGSASANLASGPT